MSQTRKYPICCPKCSSEQAVVLVDAVNVQAEPERKEELFTNELNKVVCDRCGFSFRVDKPLLYNDPEHGFMINLLPAPPEAWAEARQRFSAWLTELTATLPANVEAPDMHLVFSRTDLVERIFLLEAGLNGRIIEYIKYIIYSNNLEQLQPHRKALLFDEQDSTDENLCFVVQDTETQQLESVLEYSRQAYEGLCEMFDRDDQTPSLMELFPGPDISARSLLMQEMTTENPGHLSGDR